MDSDQASSFDVDRVSWQLQYSAQFELGFLESSSNPASRSGVCDALRCAGIVLRIALRCPRMAVMTELVITQVERVCASIPGTISGLAEVSDACGAWRFSRVGMPSRLRAGQPK